MAFAAFVLMGGGTRAAFANESVTSLGVAIPIMRYKSEGMDEKGNGVQFALKEHYIFDNGFSLVADFGIGNMKIKDFYRVEYWNSFLDYITHSEYQDGHAVYLNFDVGAGYALVNRQKFKLVFSALAGIGFQKYSEEYTLNDSIYKFITFDAGLDLYAAFKFTQHFGAFLSCKGMYSIGKHKHEYERNNVPWITYDSNWYLKIKGFMITPSAGIAICF